MKKNNLLHGSSIMMELTVTAEDSLLLDVEGGDGECIRVEVYEMLV